MIGGFNGLSALREGNSDRESLFRSAADTWHMATEDAMPLLTQFMDSNKRLRMVEKDDGKDFNKWKKGVEDFDKEEAKAREKIAKEESKTREKIAKARNQAWKYGSEDLGLDIYGKDKKNFDACYKAYCDMDEPDGPMQRQTRELRAQIASTQNKDEQKRLEGQIQSIEKEYSDRYDKLRNKMIKPRRVQLLDYANRYHERMATLKIQETVKQIVNRLDYTNAHCDARVLREMNKDLGFIEMVRKGDFQKIADSYQKLINDARSGRNLKAPDYDSETPFGKGLRDKVMEWSEKRPDFLEQMESIVRNYRQFLGNPKGETRSGGWNAAKNAVAAMFQIEVIKEVCGRLENYSKSEGGDESSYRRSIDAAVEKVRLNSQNKNFGLFFGEKYDGVPCDFEKLITKKKDGITLDDAEQSRLDQQIADLQTLIHAPGTDKDGKKITLTNTDVGWLRAMAQISYDIDVANAKSDHQDYANEVIRDMMSEHYIPMKKLEAGKGKGKG